MASDGDSFLPRIQSVFYAVFDIRQGPKIVYQVPEGLIAVPPGPAAQPSVPPTPAAETPPPQYSPPVPLQLVPLSSRNNSSASLALVSPTDSLRPARCLPSPHNRPASAHGTLFNFDDISKYVIPPSALCGRLVTCSTKRHRIIGFPAELKGKYKRNYFRYNLCFVFERGADLSCYEPIVRKVSRVLTSCEEESGFLSSPTTSPALHAILEQLYEDLNSYSETSIPIDQFNSIELKIFPFYPNPPPVKDWMVPLALINLTKRIEDNWDLTMAKVCRFIDGTNHVSRIAHLADCDIELTRQAISHLLYYQVIMTIDIFQYSNMYTLRKSIQWLADEAHVKDECGPYVTKSGKSIPDWPKLLHLYSRLKPGKTVYDWMKSYDVENLGIDPRRFTSFGVIKGFLRRVHRWPYCLPPDPSHAHFAAPQSGSPFDSTTTTTNSSTNTTLARKRGKSLSTPLRFPAYESPPGPSLSDGLRSGRPPPLSPDIAPLAAADSPVPSAVTVNISATHRARRASAAEKILEQLRSRDIHKSASGAGGATISGAVVSSPRTSWTHYHQKDEPPSTPLSAATASGIMTTVITPGGTNVFPAPLLPAPQGSPSKAPGSRRQSLIAPVVPPPSPVLSKATLTPARPRASHSPSATNIHHSMAGAGAGAETVGAEAETYPPELIPLLDGEHHTDELAVRFEAAWPLLERWLVAIGGGGGEGDYGRVVIIYR